jgi:hypothetical protein
VKGLPHNAHHCTELAFALDGALLQLKVVLSLPRVPVISNRFKKAIHTSAIKLAIIKARQLIELTKVCLQTRTKRAGFWIIYFAVSALGYAPNSHTRGITPILVA